MELILFLLIIVLFDLAALRWGFDSRDGMQRCAWKRHFQCRNLL